MYGMILCAERSAVKVVPPCSSSTQDPKKLRERTREKGGLARERTALTPTGPGPLLHSSSPFSLPSQSRKKMPASTTTGEGV